MMFHVFLLGSDEHYLQRCRGLIQNALEGVEICICRDFLEFQTALRQHPADLIIFFNQLDWPDAPPYVCVQLAAHDNPDLVVMRYVEDEGTAALEQNLDWVDYVFRPSDSTQALMILVQSIMERQKLRHSMRDLDLHYNTLMQSLPVNFYRFTPNGHLLDATPSLLALLKVANKELILGKSIFGLLIAPEHEDDFSYTLAQWGFLRGYETVIRTLDGRKLWVRHTVRGVLDQDGHLLYYQGILDDVTSEHEAWLSFRRSLEQIEHAKKEWEITVDSLPELIVVLDVDNVVLRINRTATRWDLGNVRDLVGKPFHQVLHGEKCAIRANCYLHQFLQQAGKQIEAGEAAEIEMLDPVLQRYLKIRLLPLLYAEERGAKARHICIVQDITEARRTYNALQEYMERLNILHQIDQAILESRSPVTIARNALLWLQHILPFDYAAVFEFSENTDALLELVYLEGESLSVERWVDRSEKANKLQQLLEQRALYICEDIAQADDILHLSRDICALQPRSFLYYSLVAHEQLIGAVFIGFRNVRGFLADEQQLIEQIANQLAVALHNARLLENNERARAQLQKLSQRLVKVQEEERRSLARDLHDDIGQELTALKMQVYLMEEKQKAGEPLEFASLLDEMDRILQKVRNLSHALRPAVLDDMGISAGIEWLLQKLQLQNPEIQFSFSSVPEAIRVPEFSGLTAYRIAQEALANAIRHAQPHKVDVSLRLQQRVLEMVIQDDGIGMNLNKSFDKSLQGESVGLLSIQERAQMAGGQAFFESEPGKGTTVRVYLPAAELKGALS